MELLCPICKNALINDAKRYYCQNNHSFDIAKEGYLNLNMKSSENTGDEKEMIKARRDFLERDYYKFLKDEISSIIISCSPSSLVDLACGEGYYTKEFPVKNKIGVDLSKEALKIASKKDKSSTYILRNIFDLPLRNGSVDLVTTIFAPISTEIKRIIKKDGHFVLVRPDADHMYELKQAIYDKPYFNEIEKIDIAGLKHEKEYKIKQVSKLNNIDLTNLFKMTPYYHKTSLHDFNKLEAIEQLDVTFSFIIDVYQNKEG